MQNRKFVLSFYIVAFLILLFVGAVLLLASLNKEDNVKEETQTEENIFNEAPSYTTLEEKLQIIDETTNPKFVSEEATYEVNPTPFKDSFSVINQTSFINLENYFAGLVSELKLIEDQVPSELSADYTNLIAGLEELEAYLSQKQPELIYLELYANALAFGVSDEMLYENEQLNFEAVNSGFQNAITTLESLTPPAGLEEFHAVSIADLKAYSEYMKDLETMYNTSLNLNGECTMPQEINFETATPEQQTAYLNELNSVLEKCNFENLSNFPEPPVSQLETFDYSSLKIFDEEKLNGIMLKIETANKNIEEYYN